MRKLVLVLLVTGTVGLAGERVYPVDGEPHLILENITGDIVVTRGEPGKVTVRDDLVGGSLEIEGDQQGNRIHIHTRKTWGASAHTGYRIAMPKGKLEIRTTSGTIRVDGVDGDLSLRTVNGDIEVTRVSGRLELHTVNGNILITRTGACEVDAVSFSGSVRYRHGSLEGGAYSFSTTNGDIVVEHESDASYEIAGRTINGAITDRTGKLEITKAKYANTQTLSGQFGGGKVLVRTNSVNGDLVIKSQ